MEGREFLVASRCLMPTVNHSLYGKCRVSLLSASTTRFRPPVRGPNAGADTRGTRTGPGPAAAKPTEPSGPMGDAWASHSFHLDLPRRRNVAAQLNRVRGESSAG